MRTVTRGATPGTAMIRVFRFLLVLLLAGGAVAPRPAAAQAGGITGFVVDQRGNGLFNATVRMLTGPSAGRSTTTAADGSYELLNLEPGEYTAVARRDGFDEDRRTLQVFAATTSRVDFTLRETVAVGGVLQGFVRRAGSGQPVPGAFVRATLGFGGRSTITDDEGFYRITNLGTGLYRVDVTRQGFEPQSRFGVGVIQDRTTTADFNLSPRQQDLASLSGVVLDTLNRPVAGAQVRLSGGVSSGLFATTNSAGAYVISGIIPSTYDVQVSAQGFVSQLFTGQVFPAGAQRTLNVTLEAVGEGDATVQGIVVDPFGRRVAGAFVQTTAGPQIGRFDVTNANGEYAIVELPAGNYAVRVSATGFNDQTRTVILPPDATRTLDFALTAGLLNRGTITGRVSNSAGNGLSDVLVTVVDGPSAGLETRTDRNGDYTLIDLPPGFYDVRFSRTGFQDRAVNDIEVVAGLTRAINVTLTGSGGGTTGSLTGVVRNAAGSTLANVLVRVLSGATVVGVASTNLSGVYTVDNLPAGTYTVEFSAVGFPTTTRTGIQITAGQTTTLNVTLGDNGGDRVGRITGSVVDTAGRAVPDARVELTGNGLQRVTETNTLGVFEFANVPVGSNYTVRVSRTGFLTETRSGITVTENQTVNLTFILRAEIGSSGIAGQVRDAASGLPLSGATVNVLQGFRLVGRATTDPDGRFNVPGISPGTYRVEVRRVGYFPTNILAFVRSGAPTFVQVFLRRTTLR